MGVIIPEGLEVPEYVDTEMEDEDGEVCSGLGTT
jgi:hypothetical protein